MSDDGPDIDEPDDLEPDPDLEDTMRLGLREIANDAPRGENVWNTTTSMIAVEVEQLPSHVEPPPLPAPPPPSSSDRNPVLLGVIIGLLIAILVAVVIVGVLLATSDSGDDDDNGAPAPTTTAARVDGGPIPAGLLVVNDGTPNRIIITDANGRTERGRIEPPDGTWRAIALAPNRNTVYMAREDTSACTGLATFDLTTRELASKTTTADVVALAPDGTKAIVQWSSACASETGEPEFQVAVQDFTTRVTRVLPDLRAGEFDAVWNPDGSRFATEAAGSHHVVVRDAAGDVVHEFDRPPSSQETIGWTNDGLVLVDLGLDRGAVLRVYDPATGAPLRVIARIPPIEVGGQPATPQVAAVRTAADRTYAELRGTANGDRDNQLWVVEGDRVRVVRTDWTNRELAG